MRVPGKISGHLVVSACLAALASPAMATNTDTWTDGTGNWNVGGNWSGGVVPANGDLVFLTQADATNRTVTYIATGSGYTELRVDSTGTGLMKLSQGQDALTAVNEFVGISGKGEHDLSAGSETLETGTTVNGQLAVGFNAGSHGTFSLSGTGSLSAGTEFVGATGTGTFTQAAGSNSATSFLVLGFAANSSGTYNLNGGTLSAPQEFIGDSGAGTFTQIAGTNTIGTAQAGLLQIGEASGSAGAYSLSQTGSLSVQTESLAFGGSFTQSGGTNTVTGTLNVGNGGSGTFTLHGGTLSAPQTNIISGSFSQDGGTHSPTSLYVGLQSGGTGSYSLSGTGSISASLEHVGEGGTGTFTQTAGSNTITNELAIGVASGSSGAYTLNGGTLSATSLDISGITSAGGTGMMTVGGGTLTVGSINNRDTYSQTAGTLKLTGTFTSSGTATLGGTQTWSAGSALNVIGGATTINSDLGSSGNAVSASLSNAGTTATFAASQHLSSLGVGASSTAKITGAATVLQTASLNLNASGALDLTTGALDLHYGTNPTPDASVRTTLIQSYGTGTWSATTGIISTSAALDPTHHAIGYADGADNVVHGLSSGDELVKYTFAGDANLDGKVDVSDLGILATNFGHLTGQRWDQGDFTFDGGVDVSDLGVLATNYGAGTGASGAAAAPMFQADLKLVESEDPAFAAEIGVPVPEPTAVCILGVGMIGLLRRRRRA